MIVAQKEYKDAFIAIKAERIGSPLGALALRSCDIGRATYTTGEECYITWGRNLTAFQAEWYADKTHYKIMYMGWIYEGVDRRRNYELIFPAEEIDALLVQ